MVELWHSIETWFVSLKVLTVNGWHNITPQQYGIALVSVAVVGWLLMKSDGNKA